MELSLAVPPIFTRRITAAADPTLPQLTTKYKTTMPRCEKA